MALRFAYLHSFLHFAVALAGERLRGRPPLCAYEDRRELARLWRLAMGRTL